MCGGGGGSVRFESARLLEEPWRARVRTHTLTHTGLIWKHTTNNKQTQQTRFWRKVILLIQSEVTSLQRVADARGRDCGRDWT